MKHKKKYIVEYVLFRVIAGLVGILPFRVALGLAWLIAAGTHFIGKVNVKRTHARLREVFGEEKTQKEIAHIAWRAWRNLFFNAVESIRFPKLSVDEVRKQPMAKLEGKLKSILEEQGSGFVLATPHFGNWEFAGIAADLVGIKLCAIVRMQRNPLLNDYINKMRSSFGMEIIYKDGKNWKGVVERMKDGKVLAVLPDINTKKGITVNYLNGKATVAPGAAHMAQLADCPILPAMVRRVGWTRHDAIMLDVIKPDPTADKEADRERMMNELMTGFSNEILTHPEQYFWFNKRWVLNQK